MHTMCQQVRNKAYSKELEAIGADAVIDTSSEDIPARVKEMTGAILLAQPRPVNHPDCHEQLSNMSGGRCAGMLLVTGDRCWTTAAPVTDGDTGFWERVGDEIAEEIPPDS